MIGIVGTIIPLYNLNLALSDRKRPWWTKVTDGLIALACLATIWIAVTLNFVNFHFNY